jgi:AraC-like DNA-binding protein
MDPLSDILSLLKPHDYAAAAFDLGGDWSIQFPAQDGVKCYAIATGQGWVVVDGLEPEHGSAGDCFVLPRGLSFRVTNKLDMTPVAAEVFYAASPDDGINIYQGGGTSGVVANFLLVGQHAAMLLAMLPAVVHIKKDADKAALRWSIEQMMLELADPQPGGALLLRQLATMLLIKALRLHLSDASQRSVGWLFALADPRLAAVIAAMHGDPARAWTLASLAREAGMSRTSLAVGFKERLGISTIQYLTRWRMLLAADRMLNTPDPVSKIAYALGYESETAFSAAFRKVMGCPPRQYRQNRQPAAPAA